MKYFKYLQKRENSDQKLNESEKSKVFKQTPMDILDRALRNCTWNASLYIEKIRLAEKLNVPKAEITNIVQLAFEATNNDVKGHLNVWLEYLSYIKRCTSIPIEKDIELLRKTMELGSDALERRSADINSEFDKLSAYIEYGFLKNGEQGYQIYEKVIKNPNNQFKAALWIEFAHLELNRGSDFARKYAYLIYTNSI